MSVAMYSEVQEATNFLCNFLYTKLPRRKILVFAESLANFLLLKYQDHWDPADSEKGTRATMKEVDILENEVFGF